MRYRNKIIDVYRGLAILSVVIVHTIQQTDSIIFRTGGYSSTRFSNFLALGKYGVELFFFISGFLLQQIYGSNSTQILNIRIYAMQRIFRIYPLWILFFLFEIVRFKISPRNNGNFANAISLTKGQSSIVHSPFVVTILTFTFLLFISASLWNSVPGGWSIQAEVFHYFLFLIIRKMTIKKIMIYYSALALLSIFFFEIFHEISSGSIAHSILAAYFRLNLYSTIFYFLLGVISCKLFFERNIANDLENVIDKNSNISWALIAFSLNLILPLAFGSNSQAVLFVFGMLLLGKVLLDIRFINSFLDKMGKYSYFIYFVHFRLLEILGGKSLSIERYIPKLLLGQADIFFSMLVIVISFSLLLAIPSWKLFEEPLLKFVRNRAKGDLK